MTECHPKVSKRDNEMTPGRLGSHQIDIECEARARVGEVGVPDLRQRQPAVAGLTRARHFDKEVRVGHVPGEILTNRERLERIAPEGEYATTRRRARCYRRSRQRLGVPCHRVQRDVGTGDWVATLQRLDAEGTRHSRSHERRIAVQQGGARIDDVLGVLAKCGRPVRGGHEAGWSGESLSVDGIVCRRNAQSILIDSPSGMSQLVSQGVSSICAKHTVVG